MSATTCFPPEVTPSLEHDLAKRAHILDSIEERRAAPREAHTVSATLRSLQGTEILDCPADNISEGGMRITAPIGFGLAVGQRFEVILRGDQRADRGRDLIGDGHYATVVRTEIQLEKGQRTHDRLGVGLRFDQPVML